MRVMWADERRRFLEALDKVPVHRVRRRAEMLVLYDTGCRVSELHLLNVGDYNPKRQSLMICNVKAVGRPQREVPLHARTVRALNAWLKHRGPAGHDAMFVSQKGTRLSVRQVQDDYALVCKLAKVDPRGVHTLRHTAATRLLDDKVLEVHGVSRRLGHAQISTTFRYYVHGSVEAEAQAIRRSRL